MAFLNPACAVSPIDRLVHFKEIVAIEGETTGLRGPMARPQQKGCAACFGAPKREESMACPVAKVKPRTRNRPR
jgi:hypothetical protein